MKRKIIFAVCLLAAFAVLFVFMNRIPTDAKGKLTVVFIDVEDADSIFIRFPDGKTALIDGGNTDNLDEIHNVLFKYKVKTIDYMINSHQHSDHIGTFRELIKTYQVKNFYMPASPIESDVLPETLKTLKDKKVPVNTVKRGDIICDGEVKIQVLAPYSDYPAKDENNYSAVYLMAHKENTFLFTGDAGTLVQNRLIYEYGLGQCDVVKVSHHGSDNSNSYEIFKNLKPKYAVISVSDRYERPSDYLKTAFSDFNIEYFVTYRDGNITMTSNGDSIETRKEK